MNERKRILIAVGGILTGLLIMSVGLVIAHFTNLNEFDPITAEEVLPNIPRGWVYVTIGQLIAVGGSQVIVAAFVFGWIFDRPLTWVRAAAAAMVFWIELVLFFGIIPSEWLNLAQGPLGWTSKTAFTLPQWLMLNNEVSISYAALKDFISAGYYTNATIALFIGVYKAQVWYKNRQTAPAVTKISTYGRPLTRGRA